MSDESRDEGASWEAGRWATSAQPSLLAAAPGKLHCSRRLGRPIVGHKHPFVRTRGMAESPRRDGAGARKRGRKQARTASGKKTKPELLAQASRTGQEGVGERTEAGHLAAGRTPPSQRTSARSAGATRIVDDSIRSYSGQVTEDEK